MGFWNRIAIWFFVLFDFLRSFRGSKARICSPEQTLEAVKNGKSLIRFGDGEFGIAHGDGIHYQDWSPELFDAMEAIKNDYCSNPTECPYLLAVPRAFMRCSGFRLMKKRVYVSSWARSRCDFIRSYPQDVGYGDAFLFERKNRELYRQIWSGAERVVFVHHSVKYAKLFEESFGIPTQYVSCPPKNAFEDRAGIEKQIREAIGQKSPDKRQVLILLSAGPAGKVIAYDLSKEGYHCVDTGHCWDDPLEGING